jgi:hypothetical protein
MFGILYSLNYSEYSPDELPTDLVNHEVRNVFNSFILREHIVIGVCSCQGAKKKQQLYYFFHYHFAHSLLTNSFQTLGNPK